MLLGKPMKNVNAKPTEMSEDDMRPEYDFRGGVRGKHYQAYRQGHTVTIHQEEGTIMPLLEVAKLNRRFGGLHAVNDVSFTVTAGMVVAMMLFAPQGVLVKREWKLLLPRKNQRTRKPDR
jgi:hypothetical protein